MSDNRQINPLLTDRLESLDLKPDTAPTAEQWRAFLDQINEDYDEKNEGMLILDRNFDKMIRHAVDGFFIHDTKGEIVDANQAACEMLGYSYEEVLSLNVADFEADLEPGAIWDDMTVDEVFTVEGTHMTKGGQTYPVETRVGAFMVDGRKVILALCRDVTERKEAELKLRRLNEELEKARDEAIKANHTKSSFLASMSHELRTPLNAIIGYSELLIEEMADVGDDHYAADLERILTAGQNLLSLINNILDLSKVEAGKVEVDVTEFSLHQMLDDIETTAAPLARKNNNQFSIDVTGDVMQMRSDVTKIRQILFNLVGNACKFTTDGEVRLNVHGDHDSNEVQFVVSDTGKGMNDDQLKRVFTAFEQAEASTTRKFGGTGLGLAITKHYCGILNGHISVESTLGEGSTFTVRLPTVLSVEATQNTEAAPV